MGNPKIHRQTTKDLSFKQYNLLIPHSTKILTNFNQMHKP